MRTVVLLASLMTFSPFAMADDLPVPPIPPQVPPLADAAPVPNVNAEAPATLDPDQPSVNVRMYRAKTYDSSAGFVPGSRFQSTEDRKAIQTPGFSINVPLN